MKTQIETPTHQLASLSSRQRAEYDRHLSACQRGQMSATESHEYALDLATRATPAPQAQFAGSTPLPWELRLDQWGQPQQFQPNGDRWIFAGGRAIAAALDQNKVEDPETEANAALIVHAVNSRPALLAEVERLRADGERLDWLEQQNFRPEDMLSILGEVNIRSEIDRRRKEEV